MLIGDIPARSERHPPPRRSYQFPRELAPSGLCPLYPAYTRLRPSQDLEATIWLEHYLRAETRTLVVISHDIAFLNNVVEETIILRNQELRYFEGTPAAFEINEKKQFKRATSDQAALDKKRAHVSLFPRSGLALA